MRKAVAPMMVAVLAGCAPVPHASAMSYRAVGTEPFWNLLINEHEITFTQPEQQPVKQSTPKVIVGFAGEIYRTPRIDVDVVHAQCSDGMSNRIYPDKVQLTLDGKRFNGCGGL
jgi:heat shock protein HslJ